MSKRGRDETFTLAAPLTPQTAQQMDARAVTYKKHREHLNAMFLEDLRRKMARDPSKVFEMEVNSYLKHSKKLREDFADVSDRSELLRQNSLQAADSNEGGSVFVFGCGDAGQLGLGDEIMERFNMELTRPKLLNTIPGGTNTVLKIVCGGMHTLAVCQGGLLYSWGVNDEGALGRHARKDVEGAETKPGLVTMPNNAAAIDVSTGDSHVAVATDSGAIVAWGAFRSSSGLWAFTVDEQVVRTPIVVYTPDGTDGSRVTNVASGTDHVIALTKAGDVYSWGCGEKGRLGRLPETQADNMSKSDVEAKRLLVTPSKVPNIPPASAIVSGQMHSFAICTRDDAVYAWGLNSYGQTGLPYDNDKPGSSQNEYFPKKVPALCGKGFVSGDGAETHTCMLTKTGHVYTFGRAAYGRLGQMGIDPKDDEPKPVPGRVHGLDGKVVVSVAAGGMGNGACITNEGEAYVWGYGDIGQLGRGDDQSDAATPEPLKPTKAMAGKRFSAVSFGGQHAAVLCVEEGGGGTPLGKRMRN